MRVLTRVARDALAIGAISALLVLGLEWGFRLVQRVRLGVWPRTIASVYRDAQVATATLYRRHPYLQVAAHEGARGNLPSGRTVVAIDALGYRSPERPREKPPGTLRILCAGGSTTYDVLAPSNDRTWPAQLEQKLRARGWPVEVWNAGFPGWTTLESLIALAIRDVDLAPDVVVVYHGINDMQPATSSPFHRQYEGAHADSLVRGLGLDQHPLPLWQRSVLLEAIRGALPPSPPSREARSANHIPDEALEVFGRNLNTMVGVARAYGARTLLATQYVRARSGPALDQDEYVFDSWIPAFDVKTAGRELDRLNDVMRRFPRADDVAVADVAHEVAWTDGDFGDPVHTLAPGSDKLAAYLVDRVEALLPAAQRHAADGAGQAR